MNNYLHPHYIKCALEGASRFVWTPFNYLAMKAWHVSAGRKCVFIGKTLFHILPGSTVSLGDNCMFLSKKSSNRIGIYSNCMVSTITRNAKIRIGNNCGFSGTVIGAAISVTLGDNVRCGANTLICDSDWHFDDSRAGENAPVIIDDNVWLGYGVKVLKGVHIGENSVIGAGSIVTKDIPANVVAAGVPCRVIKEL